MSEQSTQEYLTQFHRTNEKTKHWGMGWLDLSEKHIERFRLEEAGRSFAVNYTEDCITDVFRKLYLSFPRSQRLGNDPIDMTTKVSVTYDDLNNAMAESLRRTGELNSVNSTSNIPQ